jgi:Uma2 family endonuclease
MLSEAAGVGRTVGVEVRMYGLRRWRRPDRKPSLLSDCAGKITVMSTAYPISLPDYGFQPGLTLADLALQIGGIPMERIRFSPVPGTANKEDLVRLIDNEGKHCELIHGTLIEKARGSFEGVLAGWIVTHFNNYLAAHEIGIAFGDRTPIEFSPQLIYEPDCGIILSGRFPNGEYPAEMPVVDLIPNLAVEVISISNTKQEMERKLASYFDFGVEEVWYAYPKQLQVYQFVAGREPNVLGIDGLLTTPLLPGFSLNVKTLFSPPGRRLK